MHNIILTDHIVQNDFILNNDNFFLKFQSPVPVAETALMKQMV